MPEKIDSISKKIDNNYENNFDRIKKDAETLETKVNFFKKSISY